MTKRPFGLVSLPVVIAVLLAEPASSQQHLFEGRMRPVEFGCRLRLVQEFGQEEQTPERQPALSIAQRRYGGPVLASISDVAVDAAGLVYVLDRGFSKIVVFSPDGRLRNVILGGEGGGPGEFRSAQRLSLTPLGNIVVADVGLKRISRFSSDGEFLSSVNIPEVTPHDIELDDSGNLWVLNQNPLPTEPAVIVIDSTGAVFAEHFGSTSEERDRIPRRFSAEPGDLFVVGGNPWYASPIPSTWWRSGSALTGPFGIVNFPDAETAYLQNGATVLPAGTREAARLGDDRIAILYYRATVQEGQLEELVHFIDILEETGEYVRTCVLPDGKWAKSFAVSRDGRYVYLPDDDPFPRVVQYEVLLDKQ